MSIRIIRTISGWLLIVGLVVGCATTGKQEEDYTRLVSIKVTKVASDEAGDSFLVDAKVREESNEGVGISMRPSCLVLSDIWSTISIGETMDISYEVKVLLDGELIPISYNGTGIVLKAKVIPLETPEKVKVKGLLADLYLRERRIYPIDAVCVLGEETVIFEERFRSLPSNKIAPKTEEPVTEEPRTENTLLEGMESLSQEFKILTNGQVIATSDDGDTAIILLGEKDGMKVGMQLGAYRRNHLVGKAIVEEVRENCSAIKIIEMKGSFNNLEFKPIE